MRRLILLLIFPGLTFANNEGLHSINLSYSQFPETLSLRNIEQELRPHSLAAAYSYIAPSGSVWRSDIWNESAQKTVIDTGKVDKQAWAGRVAYAYPLANFEFELSYSYSRPKLDALSITGNRLEERSKTVEYGVGASYYLEKNQWSLVPSIQLAYQDSSLQERIRVNNTVLWSALSESGWLVSSGLIINYVYELNTQADISPFVAVSWTEFFEGKGLTRTTALRRNVSFSSVEETELDEDGTGLASAGVRFAFDRYHIDLSVDETIDLPDVGTQVNAGFGIVW